MSDGNWLINISFVDHLVDEASRQHTGVARLNICTAALVVWTSSCVIGQNCNILHVFLVSEEKNRIREKGREQEEIKR